MEQDPVVERHGSLALGITLRPLLDRAHVGHGPGLCQTDPVQVHQVLRVALRVCTLVDAVCVCLCMYMHMHLEK